MVYMGYPDGDERHPGEFSMGEAMELYPHMSESGINKRLVALVKAGHYTRRRAIVNGHSVWLYKKAN